MRWNSRWKLTHRFDTLSGLHRESVIQDVDIPLERAPEFLEFFQREIGILPVWICPIRPGDPQSRFDLYPLVAGRAYVNFGFWDVVKSRVAHPSGHFNRLVERKVAELGGIKSLYSESYYPREEFWGIYGETAYRRLKGKVRSAGQAARPVRQVRAQDVDPSIQSRGTRNFSYNAASAVPGSGFQS